MAGGQTNDVRSFPLRLLVMAVGATLALLLILAWAAYDGLQQSRATEKLVRSAQSLHSRLLTQQQSLSSLLMLQSATGDIRWSYRYTKVVDELGRISADAKPISGDFAAAVGRTVRAGIALAQLQAQAVEQLRSNRLAQAKALVGGPEFEQRRGAFQGALENLGQAIEGLSAQARADFETRIFWSTAAALPVLIFTFMVGWVCLRRIREWRVTLDQMMAEARRHEAELEARVAERTTALQATQDQFRAALDNMSGGMFMVDRDLILRLFNDRFRELYDLPDELVQIGKPLAGVLNHRAQRGEYGPGEPEDLVAARIKSYRDAPSLVVEDHIATTGRTIELHRAGLDDGSIVAVFNDITERKEASAVLEDAHAVMRDSIQYASRIQRSLLPNGQDMQDMFADHFCIWLPRDVVGGDMYWVRRDRRGYFVALFDCTGHGVPGALMTTIAVSALDVAFNETGDPSRLVARVNQIIKQALGQDDDTGISDDGLEMGICLVEPERMRVTFAGARFELLSAVGDRIEVFKGDKSGLGYCRVPNDRRFTNHSIRLRRGQRFYMYTDGITDQVGGNKRRAFGRKRLVRTLEEIAHHPMGKQAQIIGQVLDDYQGHEVRRDDISMIGFMPVR